MAYKSKCTKINAVFAKFFTLKNPKNLDKMITNRYNIWHNLGTPKLIDVTIRMLIGVMYETWD